MTAKVGVQRRCGSLQNDFGYLFFLELLDGDYTRVICFGAKLCHLVFSVSADEDYRVPSNSRNCHVLS